MISFAHPTELSAATENSWEGDGVKGGNTRLAMWGLATSHLTRSLCSTGDRWGRARDTSLEGDLPGWESAFFRVARPPPDRMCPRRKRSIRQRLIALTLAGRCRVIEQRSQDEFRVPEGVRNHNIRFKSGALESQNRRLGWRFRPKSRNPNDFWTPSLYGFWPADAAMSTEGYQAAVRPGRAGDSRDGRPVSRRAAQLPGYLPKK